MTTKVQLSSSAMERFCTALRTLLMMTSESMLSKRPVLGFSVPVFFLLTLFSPHIYGIPKYNRKCWPNIKQCYNSIIGQKMPKF